MGLKANAFRVGPDNLAMLGLPMLIMAMEQNLCLVCHKVACLLGQGIVLNDLAGYLESPSAAEYLKEQRYTLKVGLGEVAFVPAGYVSTVTYYAAAREQETSNPYAFYMSYTMWAPAPAAKLEPNVWQAIAGYNTKYLDTVATSRVFSSRAALMTRFVKLVVWDRSRECDLNRVACTRLARFLLALRMSPCDTVALALTSGASGRG